MSAPDPRDGAAQSVGEVLSLFEQHGLDRYDEEVTQLDHALQTAALAVADGASDALVAAALLHDVGHLLELAAGAAFDPDRADLHHEARGARYLATLFPEPVTMPIALHVRAKRYRCTVEPGYRAALSPASASSLARQGGLLDASGVRAFEANPSFEDAVRLRGWDDGGKRPDLDVQPLHAYVPLLEGLSRAPGDAVR
jgi:phosphonate degradation associated HDIG domain protein